MSEVKSVIEGVVVPLLLPLDENECVDEPAFRALIRHCLDGGADVLFAGGTSGLGPLLTDDQWTRMMEIAHDEVGDVVPLLGGVITTSTVRAVERIRILDRIGFEHMVVTPTFYVAPTRDEEFLSHFDGCRHATDMNMIVYNMPSCTGVYIPPNVVLEMVRNGWTTVVKESSGERDYFEKLSKTLDGSGATLLQGFEPDIEWGFSLGAKGIVPTCANYAPKLFAAAWRAHQTGDKTRLSETQEHIMHVREVLLLGDKNWLAGALYGICTLGIGDGNTLRPIQKPNDDEKRKIEELTEANAIGAQPHRQ
jgi:4-hydroxy-tetrahydrodipicolinate synthase